MKNFVKLLFISMLLIAFGFAAHAQQISDANELYDMYKFEEASVIYQKIIAKNQRGKELATERLADCYRFMGKKVEAEKWYATAVEYPDVTNRAFFNYGVVLRDNGKYIEAKEQFLKYAAQAPGDLRGNLYASYMDQLVEWGNAVKNVEKKRHGNLVALSAGNLNTEFMEVGAVTFGPKGVVFASTRPTDPKKKKRVAEKMKLWQTTVDTTPGKVPSFTEATLLMPVTRTTLDVAQGPASFTADGKTMFFTQSYTTDDGYGGVYEGLEIVSSTFNGKEWSKPEPFSYNSKEFSNAHPTVSGDGKMLIYTSDMPGGYGATDVYMSRLNGNRWEKPRNLGANINTSEIEKYPILVNDSVLYFSSNGHITLGGQDIMKSVYHSGAWTKAENMRAPINSIDDDNCFVPLRDEKLAMLSSTRAGGKGESDIYVLCNAPAAPLVVSGVVEAQGVTAQLHVNMRDDNGQMLALVPNAQGAYSFEVKDGHRYIVKAWADGFSADSVAINVKDDNIHDTIAVRKLVLKVMATPAATTVAEAKKPAPVAQPEVKKEEPKSAPAVEPAKEEAKPAVVEPVQKTELKKEEPKVAQAPAEPASAPVVVAAPVVAVAVAEAPKKEEAKKEEPKSTPVAEPRKEVAKPVESAPIPKTEVVAAPVAVAEVKAEPAPQPEVKKEVAKPTPVAEPKKEQAKAAPVAKPAEPTPAPKAEPVAVAEAKVEEPASQPEVKKAEPKPAPVAEPKKEAAKPAEVAPAPVAPAAPQKEEPKVAPAPKPAPVVAESAQPQEKTALSKKFKNIYFDKNSIYPAKKSYGAIANLLTYLTKNSSANVHFDLYSDAQGTEEVNLEISQRRANILVAYMQQQGIAAERMTISAYGDVKPVNRCHSGVECSEEEHAENRRAEISLSTGQKSRVLEPRTNEEVVIENQIVESVANDIAEQLQPTTTVVGDKQSKVKQFHNISYAMNSLYPDKSSYANIGNLIVFMQSHPGAIVELDVHSDAQGSESVAMKVADRRAKILANYLKQNGIAENRMVLRAYGSARPLNNCAVGVTCTDEEHAANRRVEVLVKY